MAETRITVRNDGPLRVEGTDIVLVDADGNRFGLSGRTAISLCRCGHSQNKPFCDSSHARTGFASACPARELPPPAPKP